jgi:hypothetical protein
MISSGNVCYRKPSYCFRHCAFCNLDWGITIYYHFKLKKKSSMILDLHRECTTINNFNTMNFDVWQMVDPIKVGVGLSETIASHKTLTLVVGMTMILDDFLRQCMISGASGGQSPPWTPYGPHADPWPTFLGTS